MTIAIFNSNAAISARPAGNSIIAKVTENAGALFRTWQRRRRERAELATLSDVELAELSMTRADVGSDRPGPFWSLPPCG